MNELWYIMIYDAYEIFNFYYMFIELWIVILDFI